MLPPQGNALSFDPERQVSTMGFMQTSHSSDSETSETSETPENAVTELVDAELPVQTVTWCV